MEFEYLPLEVKDLDQPSIKEIQEEIGESAESRARCLQVLRKQLKDVEDLEPCLEENFLLGFLRVSKFDCCKAMKRIMLYYNFMDKSLDLFKDCFFQATKMPNVHNVWAGPKRLKNNSMLIRIFIGVDHTKITFIERMYLEFITYNYKLMNNPINQIAGVSIILDVSGFTARSLLYHKPTAIYPFMNFLQNIQPTRLKIIHVVNVPPIFSILVKLVTPFISEKIKSRLFIHSRNNWELLHSHIPPSLLPEEYGGLLENSSMIDLMQSFQLYEEYFIEQFKYGFLKSKHRREPMLKTLRNRRDHYQTRTEL